MPRPYGNGRNPVGRGVNFSPGQRPRESLTNGSSSRKYAGKDLIINHPTDDIYSSNSEHLINTAASLKTQAISTQAILLQGRLDLENIRQQILNVPNTKPGDVRIPGQAFDEHDLKIAQSALTARVHATLGTHPVAGIDNRIKSNSRDIILHSLNGAFLPSVKGRGVSVNAHAPKIDHIRVDVQYKKGVHDVFFATMTYDIPVAGIHTGDIAAVRIFRAVVDNPQLSIKPRLSVQGAERLRSDTLRTRAKNQDYLGNYEQTLRELGIDNAMTALNPFDATRKRRVGAETFGTTALDHHSARDNQASRDRNMHDLASFIHPQSFLNVDRSVITNIKAIKNLQIQNPDLAHREVAGGVRVGAGMYHGDTASKVKGEQVRQNRTQFNNQSPFLIDNGNKLDFKEVAVISAHKLEGQLLGDVFESYYVDHTITYGKRYLYYILTVDRNMAQSQRSQIVTVTVDGHRHPGGVAALQAFPINNTISLSMTCDDLLVEKFEVYRKELTGVDHPEQAQINVHGAGGYHTSHQIVTRLSNGFLKIGESINGGKDGATFYDRNARPGHRYVYRVMTVDVFGNKNAEAKEIEVFYPEATKHVHLSKPTIKVDIDTKTNKTRVHINCDDTNVTALFLSRRDITIGQNGFVVPGSPERIKQGGEATGHVHAKSDPTIGPTTDKVLSWNGYFDIRQNRDVLFIDKTSQIDHTYQYQVYGVDRFGNKTPVEQSGRVTVVDIAQVDAPKNLVGAVRVDENGQVSGIHLRWEDAMVNFSAEDRLGNQEDLRETSVRTLFQVERRQAEEDTWHSFPMVGQLELFDSVKPAVFKAPPTPLYPTMHPNNYQSRQLLRNFPTYKLASTGPVHAPNPSAPPPVEVNKTYIYRIQAFQSGGFVSNFSPNIAVSVVLPVSDPVGFSAKIAAGNTNVRPVNVVVQWTMPKESGPVDFWEVERSLINIYAAGNFSNANPDDFAKVQYSPFRTIHQASYDGSSHVAGAIAPKGYSYTTDMDVPLGNMVFYRIRAHASVGGSVSSWVYCAFKLRDAAYEAKQAAILAEEERKRLAAIYAAAHPPAPIVQPKPAPPSSFAYVPRPIVTSHPAQFIFAPPSHIAVSPAIVRYVPPPPPRRVVVPPPPAFLARNVLRFR